MRTWVALRESSVESRFEALHATGLTALVGREDECELLLRRWSKAKSNEGQLVLIGGEAGIGKSRLTAALMKNLGGEPPTRWRYFCSPQRADSAFYPIIGQMERAAGWRTMTQHKRSSTSSMPYSRGPPPRPKTQRRTMAGNIRKQINIIFVVLYWGVQMMTGWFVTNVLAPIILPVVGILPLMLVPLPTRTQVRMMATVKDAQLCWLWVRPVYMRHRRR
jgi:hypothetical protein